MNGHFIFKHREDRIIFNIRGKHYHRLTIGPGSPGKPCSPGRPGRPLDPGGPISPGSPIVPVLPCKRNMNRLYKIVS